MEGRQPGRHPRPALDGGAILAVGLGAIDNFLGNTGEVLDRKTRAAMMDKGIELIMGLWKGERVYSGQHYQMDLSGRTDLSDVAQPVQDNIPIWVVGAWPSNKSMTRVLRCDGVLPNVIRDGQPGNVEPDDVRGMLAWLRERGGAGEGFDFVVEGETAPGDADDANAKIGPLRDAGATWWLETRWQLLNNREQQLTEVRNRIEAGPPRL